MLIVTFESREHVITHLQGLEVQWPVLLDETCDLYRRYHMYSAGFWDIWGPRTWWAYLKEILKGNMPKPSTGNIQQRGGNVLIDEFGIIQFHHVGSGPADRPSVATLLRAVEQ